MTTNYEIVIRWDAGSDRQAVAFQNKVTDALRELDPHGKCTMFGNSQTGAGSTWISERKAAAARWRKALHGEAA